jgi:hypothetical protein
MSARIQNLTIKTKSTFFLNRASSHPIIIMGGKRHFFIGGEEKKKRERRHHQNRQEKRGERGEKIKEDRERRGCEDLKAGIMTQKAENQ